MACEHQKARFTIDTEDGEKEVCAICDDVTVETLDEEGHDTTPSNMRSRVRTCDDCGKKLGGTVGLCYECGGEKPQPTREERLADARWWKIMLGVDPDLIEEAHQNG